MIKDRVLALANFVEESKTFDMRTPFHESGSPACLLGHAKALARVRGWDIYSPGGRLLGLNPQQIDKLYSPDGSFHFHSEPNQGNFITQPHAIACLRHLAETGEVDWEETEPCDH